MINEIPEAELVVGVGIANKGKATILMVKLDFAIGHCHALGHYYTGRVACRASQAESLICTDLQTDSRDRVAKNERQFRFIRRGRLYKFGPMQYYGLIRAINLI